MLDMSRVRNYYIAVGYTDLRRGIDSLAAIVQLQYGQELREVYISPAEVHLHGVSGSSAINSTRLEKGQGNG